MKKSMIIMLICATLMLFSINVFADVVEYNELDFNNKISANGEILTGTLNEEKATLINDPFGYTVYAKGYKADLKKGETVSIDMQSKDVAPYVIVMKDLDEEAETIVAYGGNGTRFFIPEDETYYIIATTISESVEGNFELSMKYIEKKTYYVDAKNGNDENSGISRKKAFATLNQALITIENEKVSGEIYLMSDIEVNEVLEIYRSIATILPYNGKEYKIQRATDFNDTLIEIYEGTLNLGESGMKGKITFDGDNGSQFNASMICNSSGIVNMYDGIVFKNNDQSANRGYAGTIFNQGGIFNMYGGEITNNSAEYGAGVCNTAYAMCNIYGGKITHNTALSLGGGIFNDVSTLYIGDNAEISYNTAQNCGGGIYDYHGVCTIEENAKISENQSNCEESDIYYDEEIEPVSDWNNPYTDVSESDWYYETVKEATQFGLFNGTTPTTFEPKAQMTKLMFITVLSRLSGEAPEDVVQWALNRGIVAGMGETPFNPKEAMNREEMAVMLYNFLKIKNAKLDIINENPEPFFDEVSFSPWAVEAIRELQKYELIQGKQENFYDAFQTAGRAEVAALLMRLVDRLAVG